MKRDSFVGILALIAGIAIAQSPRPAVTGSYQATAADREIASKLAAQIEQLTPGVSKQRLMEDTAVFAAALPGLRKMLAEKPCSGQPCGQKIADRALFDIYSTTLQRKGDILIGPSDLGDTVSGTNYLAVWSDPKGADFKLMRGHTVAWSERTDKDRFMLKADYVLHIEKAGYETVDIECSNKSEGRSCGGKLTTKK